MKKGFPLVLLAAVLLPACVSAPPEKPVRRNTGRDCSREIRIGDEVLKAMKNNRYRELALLLREGPLSGMSEQDFRTSVRRWCGIWCGRSVSSGKTGREAPWNRTCCSVWSRELWTDVR